MSKHLHLKRFEEVRHYYLIPYDNVDEIKSLIKTDSEIFTVSTDKVNEFLISKGFRYTGIFNTDFYEQVDLGGWLLEVHGIQPIALGMFGM